MSGEDSVEPVQIKRGDLVIVQGKLAKVASRIYEIVSGVDSTPVSCVNVEFTVTGEMWTVKIDQITKVGRDFP